MNNILMWTESTGWQTNEASTFFFGVLPMYGLLILIGFLVTAAFVYIEWNKKGYNTWDYLFMVSFTVIFALYGAKLWYMVFSPKEAFGDVTGVLDVLTMIFIPAFGRSIFGTIVFTPIGLWIWQRVWGGQYKVLELIDMVMLPMFIGQAIGRFGNMFDHNVYGSIVTKEQIDWLPNWIVNHMYIDGEYRNPLFIFESFADVGAFVILWCTFKTNSYWKDGSAGFTYIGTYGLIRLIMEPFRDSAFKMSWGSFPTSIIASIILIIVGFGLFIYLQWFNKTKN